MEMLTVFLLNMLFFLIAIKNYRVSLNALKQEIFSKNNWFYIFCTSLVGNFSCYSFQYLFLIK